MEVKDIIIGGYRHFFGKGEIELTQFPRSGSDRKYFRIKSPERTLIGAWNPIAEENRAFIGFSEHFMNKGLNVPEVYGFLPEKNVYFLRDLGDTTLFTWLKNRPVNFDVQAVGLYRKALDHLVLFQTRGIEGLNLDLCYPHRSFDRQSMMWDMNYFKYMFLKLLAVPFNERDLENDFNKLADFLLEAGQDFFLYRDFQTANIMIVDGEPWFIDYQGGRRGAPQYDAASLLHDAKSGITEEAGEELLGYYVRTFCNETGLEERKFMDHYTGFAMIRLMQALGAFGFRGLYERKPTFTESIVPGVRRIESVAARAEQMIDLPELFRVIRNIRTTTLFRELSSEIRISPEL
jgi:aminoglycoside/choline kinase family phosphotransferase